MVELHQLEKTLLFSLKDGKKTRLRSLLKKTNLPYASIARASIWLSSKGYTKIEKRKRTVIHLDTEGKKISKTGLPERVVIDVILQKGGRTTLNTLATLTELDNDELNIALGWGKKKGWLTFSRENGKLFIIVKEKPKKGIDEQLIESLTKGAMSRNSLTPQQLSAVNTLMKRPKIIYQKEDVDRFIQITKEGLAIMDLVQKEEEEISQLTPELIKSGKWREVRFRKYNI